MSRALVPPVQLTRCGVEPFDDTIVTSGFVHADLPHLIFNMVTFYFFAFPLERQIGSARFAALYLLGLVVSDLGTYFKHRNDPQYASLGASGAISAVLVILEKVLEKRQLTQEAQARAAVVASRFNEAITQRLVREKGFAFVAVHRLRFGFMCRPGRSRKLGQVSRVVLGGVTGRNGGRAITAHRAIQIRPRTPVAMKAAPARICRSSSARAT